MKLVALLLLALVATATAQCTATTCAACQGPSCGWCDSTHSCLAGSGSGPTNPTIKCNAWSFATNVANPCIFPGPVDRCDCYCQKATLPAQSVYVGQFDSPGCTDNSCASQCAQKFPTDCVIDSSKSVCQLTLAGDVKKYLPVIIGVVVGAVVLLVIVACCCCSASCCLFSCCADLAASCCACIPCCARRKEVILLSQQSTQPATIGAYHPPAYQPMNNQAAFYPAQGGYPAQQQGVPMQQGYPQHGYPQVSPQQQVPQQSGLVMPGGNFMPPPQASLYAPSAK